jgi:(+)-trans-carveol dehydrogenase
MNRLKGKVAFVTGAARGQGRSHAIRMAEEGADILAIDVCGTVGPVGYPPATSEDLATTVAAVEALDRRIIADEVDIRDVDGLRKFVDAGTAELGKLDIVAANAGIGSLAHPAIEISDELWHDMLDINLSGAWNTARAAAPHMIAGGNGGAIVFTSSTASLQGYASVAHYVAAKHGVVGLMRSLAVEFGPHSIRVNCVAPTQCATDMILNDEVYKMFCPDIEEPTVEDFRERSGSVHLLPIPWVEPVDISNAVVFLASDEARYITAVSLPVDAGNTQH